MDNVIDLFKAGQDIHQDIDRFFQGQPSSLGEVVLQTAVADWHHQIIAIRFRIVTAVENWDYILEVSALKDRANFHLSESCYSCGDLKALDRNLRTVRRVAFKHLAKSPWRP